MSRRAIVVGGGITGATTSLLLGRRGYQVTLVERQPIWSVLGSGISLIFPALRALDRIGVLSDCVQAGQVVEKVNVCNADSETVDEVVMAPPSGTSIPGLVGMMRPKLHEVLSAAALDQGLQLKLGTIVEAVNQSGGDWIEVKTSDGAAERFDLLVAADGLHSRTRGLIFGDQLEPPSFRRQAIFRAMVPKPKELEVASIFRGRVDVHAGMTPTSPETGYMYCFIPTEDRTRPPAEDLADLMRHHLAPFSGLAAELRETIVDSHGIDYRPLETFMLPRPWHLGRAIVLGDAAHSTTPHLAAAGAMCLEDAIVLGEELDRDEDVPQALARLTERRFERCRFVVDASTKLSDDQMFGNSKIHGELFPKGIALLQEEF